MVNRKLGLQNFTENSVEKNALLPKEQFLRKYKISATAFDSAKLKWTELQKIHADYLANHELFQNVTNTINAKFLTNDAKEIGVHSVRSRIKKPDSLIEKIIRKTLDAKKRGEVKNITVKNYTSEINDLIGIRILHVFKNDWFNIHNFIINICEYKTKEKPTAYYRKGDEKAFIDECKRNGCDAKVHPKAYRSIHYIINPFPKKNFGFAEICRYPIFPTALK